VSPHERRAAPPQSASALLQQVALRVRAEAAATRQRAREERALAESQRARSRSLVTVAWFECCPAGPATRLRVVR